MANKRRVSASSSTEKGSQLEHHDPTTGPDSRQTEVVPNWWWNYRQIIREAAAEFTGVMILIIFGTGVVCQVVLSSITAVAPSQKGDYLSISFGWAVGTAMGMCAHDDFDGELMGDYWRLGFCGNLGFVYRRNVFGKRCNLLTLEQVTLALATWRGFPWRKVPIYIFAQLLGGIVGAAIVYANYFHAIDLFEGGRGVRTLSTAGLFSTYALDYMTNVSCFFSEFMASAVLLIMVLATTDPNNSPPPAGLFPLILFLLILGIGYAINPARDLGPRILTSMVGYGTQVYTFRNQYWLWCPVIAPILGAQAGTIFYDVLLFNGPESRINRPRVVTREAV
ncbi:major intrinsic protein superfamily membrane channel protein [Roridomyces roridus]|uniref:Major intrinsic protein superfamily membrane channel protein n=1 Tax=Roridomyces roridus TaxID=1738132 RepID=A0AAD7FJT2_9AGAR|nr:major intrinsic protein superfamily membrane channel protein [Roridomyces roridus]